MWVSYSSVCVYAFLVSVLLFFLCSLCADTVPHGQYRDARGSKRGRPTNGPLKDYARMCVCAIPSILDANLHLSLYVGTPAGHTGGRPTHDIFCSLFLALEPSVCVGCLAFLSRCGLSGPSNALHVRNLPSTRDSPVDCKRWSIREPTPLRLRKKMVMPTHGRTTTRRQRV